MNYKQVIDRIFDNLHVEKENTKDLKVVRNDISDSLIDAFGRSAQPRKEVSYTIAETVDVTEDFADDTLVDGMTLTDITVNSGVGEIAATDFGTIEVEPLKIINSVSFTVNGTFGAIAVIGTVKVKDGNGTEVFSDTFTQSSYPETHEFSPGVNGVDYTLEVVIKAPADMADCTVDNFTYNEDDFTQDMPDDFYIPLEVNFDAPDKRYASKEMTREQYVNWNPNRALAEDADDLYEWDTVHTTNLTEENIDYDNLIGYFFQQLGATAQLIWKPKFSGTITISYAYLPSITAADGTAIDINRRFADLMIWGATIKGLVRKLTSDNINEAKLAGIQISLRKYESDFNRLLHEFTNFMHKRTEAARILPFSILNDGYQDLEVQ